MNFRYLRPEDVRRLDSYEFAARLLAEGWLAGRHRSRLRGPSIEFHEYRAYSPGDDLALVDWRVFARTDRHYVKTFEQETNLTSNATSWLTQAPSIRIWRRDKRHQTRIRFPFRRCARLACCSRVRPGVAATLR